MNALTIYSLIAFFLVLCIGGYWLYSKGRDEGVSEQKEKGNKKVSDYAKKNAKRLYDGVIGSRAFRVFKPGKWKPRTPS